nr:immunoglobulin heavy chain junction region [Mus musculus]
CVSPLYDGYPWFAYW